MEKDQRDLLREFNAQRVRYLVIGGYAFSHYTEPRATKDLELFIDASAENAARVYASLARFGAPLSGVTPKDCKDPETVFQVGLPPSRIDILQAIEGIDFDAAWNDSVHGMTGDDIPVHYISVEDLIRNKLAMGRLRDLADVEALQNSQAANSKPPNPDGY